MFDDTTLIYIKLYFDTHHKEEIYYLFFFPYL